MAIQDLCDEVSDVSGVRIVYSNAEGQSVPCSLKDRTQRCDKMCIRI